MSGTHSAPWGGKGRCRACHRATEVVIGVTVAARELRATRPEDGLHVRCRRALRQQCARHPEIHDAPIRLRKTLPDAPSLNPALVDLAGLLRGDRHRIPPGATAVRSELGPYACGVACCAAARNQMPARRASPARLCTIFTQGALPAGLRRWGF